MGYAFSPKDLLDTEAYLLDPGVQGAAPIQGRDNTLEDLSRDPSVHLCGMGLPGEITGRKRDRIFSWVLDDLGLDELR